MRAMVRRGIEGNIVFVGMPGSGVSDLMSALRNDPQIRGRLAHITHCDDEHLAAVYDRAAFAVYPSLYEGWGLGVTEAMAHGKRCIIATGSSLEEASFGTASAVHPLATGEWVDAIEQFFKEPGSVGDLRLPTWSDTTDDLLHLVNR